MESRVRTRKLGERDRVIAHLEQAFAERSDSMVILRVYPVLDGLHPDPRFQDLMRRIGLPASRAVRQP
jgi:hypothetical protein